MVIFNSYVKLPEGTQPESNMFAVVPPDFFRNEATTAHPTMLTLQ